jgi:hypothetical protein
MTEEQPVFYDNWVRTDSEPSFGTLVVLVFGHTAATKVDHGDAPAVAAFASYPERLPCNASMLPLVDELPHAICFRVDCDGGDYEATRYDDL